MNNIKKNLKGRGASKFLALFMAFLMILSSANMPAYAQYFASDEESGSGIEVVDAGEYDADEKDDEVEIVEEEAVAADVAEDAADESYATRAAGAYSGSAPAEAEPSAVANGSTSITINATLTNVQAGYFVYNSASDAISISPLTGSVTVSDFTTDTLPGYALVFVRPVDNYLFTNLTGSGANNLYPLAGTKASDFGNIAGYPNLMNIVAAARDAGYTAILGWSRSAGETNNVVATVTASGQQPTMQISAESDKTAGVKPGDVLTFTVTVTPGALTGIEASRVSIAGVVAEKITVNGASVSSGEISDFVEQADGTYVGTVTHTATVADCESGIVSLSVTGSTTYEYILGLTSAAVTTTSVITKEASTSCTIAAKNSVNYVYGYENTEGITDFSLLPDHIVDETVYYAGQTVTVASAPASPIVDAANGGYWTFEGWTIDGADAPETFKSTGESVDIEGTWVFNRITAIVGISGWTYDGQSADDKVKTASASGYVEAGFLSNDEPVYSYRNADGETVSAPKDAGTYVLVASWTLDNGQTVSAEQEFTIAKRAVTLRSASETRTYTGEVLRNTGVSIASGSFVDGEGFTYDYDSMPSIIEVGTVSNDYEYTLTGNAKSGNYDITPEKGILEVTKADATITVSGNVKTDAVYSGEQQQVAGFTVNYGDIAEGQIVVSLKDGVSAAASGTDAGTYYMGLDDDAFDVVSKNYNVTIASVFDGRLEISKADTEASVSGISATVDYDGDLQQIEGFTVELPEGVSADEVTIVLAEGAMAYASGTDVGTYSMGLAAESFVASSRNYNVNVFLKEDGVLTINPKAVTVKIEGKTLTTPYNGSEQQILGYDIVTDLPAGLSVSLKSGAAAKAVGTDAGTHRMGLTAESFVATGDNYVVTFEVSDGWMEITPATAVIDVQGHVSEVYYDGSEHSVSGYDATVVAGVEVSTNNAATVTGIEVGTYYMGLDADDFVVTSSNYNASIGTVTDGKLVVKPQSIVPGQPGYNGIEVGTLEDVVYDGTSQQQAPVVTASGVELRKDVDYTVSFSSDTVSAGTVVVTVEGIGNYSGVVTRTYEITPRPVVLTSASATEYYTGSKLVAESVTVSGMGFVEGEGASYAYGAGIVSAGSVANDFTYELDANTLAKNYAIETVSGTLVVAPRPVVLTSATDAKRYDGTPLTAESVAVSGMGFVEGEGATYTFGEGIALVGSVDNAFTYELDSNTDARNYDIETVFGTLTVADRDELYPIVLTGSSASFEYDGTAKSASGFETLSFEADGHGYTVEGATSSVSATDAGTYATVLSGTPVVRDTQGSDVSAQFDVTYVPGTLTIVAVPTTVVPSDAVDPDPGGGNGGDDGNGVPVVPATTGTDGSNGADGTGVAGSTSDAAAGDAGSAENVAQPAAVESAATDVAGDVEHSEICWTHVAMVVGMLVTAVYGLVVTVRRNKLASDLEEIDKDIVGDASPVAAN
jgi:hypothetical protein